MSAIDLFGPAELAALRAMALSALPDTGRVVRGGTGGVVDGNGDYIPNVGVEIYNGRMRMRSSSTQDTDLVVGDTQLSVSAMVCVLPWTAPDVLIDDVIHVDTSSDPRIATRSFRVTVVAYGSLLTDRRLGVELVA